MQVSVAKTESHSFPYKHHVIKDIIQPSSSSSSISSSSSSSSSSLSSSSNSSLNSSSCLSVHPSSSSLVKQSGKDGVDDVDHAKHPLFLARTEILTHLVATEKETDIYKVRIATLLNSFPFLFIIKIINKNINNLSRSFKRATWQIWTVSPSLKRPLFQT
jgi:hypothetical protein